MLLKFIIATECFGAWVNRARERILIKVHRFDMPPQFQVARKCPKICAAIPVALDRSIFAYSGMTQFVLVRLVKQRLVAHSIESRHRG